MSDSDPKETLQEFREYFAGVYVARHRLVARIGLGHLTLVDLLADNRKPITRTMAKRPIVLSEQLLRL
ncbi:MAG TPA: hypothetical protein VFO40_04110 [Chthoniobacterales bacterium]|nr:hypothetical protein [Chthoniobacterales bacterium]